MSKKKKKALEAQEKTIKTVKDEPVPGEKTEPVKCDEWKNKVTPRVQVEYKVVLLERTLAQHQTNDKLYADMVRVELSFTESDTAIKPFTKGAKFSCTPSKVEIFWDTARTKPFDGDLKHDQLSSGKWVLYLYGKTEGDFKAELTLNDPQDAKIELENNPAEQAMTVVKLEMELYSDKKAHSKVAFDASEPTRTKLSAGEKISRGRLLQVQDNARHCRAKLVLKKPDGNFWSGGENHYTVTLNKKTGSGDVNIFKTETGGVAEPFPLKLDKNNFTEDKVFWVEGAGAVDKLRDLKLIMGMDRTPGGLSKTEKMNGDFASFTIIQFKKVTPDTADYKQWCNLPEDSNKPAQSQKFKAKAELTKPLENVKIMFSLVPDANNPTDIPDAVKYTGPGDNEAAVNTNNQGIAESAKLTFSRYGGDKFQVFAYAQEAPPAGENKPAKNLSRQITIWRKLFYRVNCMKRYGSGSYSNRLDEAGMKTKMGDMFVDLERSGDVSNRDFQSVVKDSKIAAFNTAVFGADVKRTINIGLVEAQTGDSVTNVDRLWTATKGYNATDKTTTETLTGFTMEMETKNAWLDSAKYSNTDVTPESWIALNSDKVSLSLDGLEHKVKVDLTGVITNLLPANKVRVQVTLKKLSEWSGDSTGNNILIGMRWREIGYPGKEKKAARQTTLHEMGHFIGMTAKKKPDAAQSANPLRYDQNGPHCKFDTNKCVMYHQFQMVFDFCATCKESLKARNISDPKISADADY